VKECLVIIPAFNEEQNILFVLEGLEKYASEYVDVIVIDDCSKDNTSNKVIDFGYKTIKLCSNLGYSGAVLTGFKYAMSRNYKYVIQFDGDGQHDPREILDLIKCAEDTGDDIIIGSRFLERTEYNHGKFRSMGTTMFSKTIKLLTGKKITDPTSGLQILNKKVFSYYARAGNYPDYPDANLLILMFRLGFRISEKSVLMHDRISGVGMHDSVIKNIKYMINMYYSIFISLLKERKIV
jgi:glycosyltransferase involved in cell wall biosynthesis